jgi:hypothetical protein
MITITYYQLILMVLIAVFTYFAAKISVSIFEFFKIRSAIKKMKKEDEDRVAKMKAEGRMHKWVTMPVKIPGKGIVETSVCEETGYCPSVDSFVEVSKIKQIQMAKQQEKEYQQFRDSEIQRLSDEYNIDPYTMDNLVQDVFKIKRNFHTNKMKESIKELKEMFGDNVRVVSDIDELKDTIKEVTNGKETKH